MAHRIANRESYDLGAQGVMRQLPVLDIQSRYRYGYSLSLYVFQVSQGIALYPSDSV